MKERVYPVVVVILVILNVVQLVRLGLPQESGKAVTPEGQDSLEVTVDEYRWPYAGAYTYPGFGACVAQYAPQSESEKTPLTLAIFMTSATTCPAVLSEKEVFHKLIPVLEKRGQLVVAVCAPEDSTDVAEFLEDENFDIPLAPLNGIGDQDEILSLSDMGISPYFMPFKVLYDTSMSAIYVRGADHTEESQLDFERAVLRLSSLVYEGKL